MQIKKLINNNRGDTIIEVLIAVVILTLIITGAYVTSNDSLKNIIDAQERIQALGVAQSQTETLRAEASSASVFGGGNNAQYLNSSNGSSFCFNSLNSFQDFKSAPAYPDPRSCTYNNKFTVQISGLGQTQNPSTNTYGFQINVSWPSVSSYSSKDSLTINYRVSI